MQSVDRVTFNDHHQLPAKLKPVPMHNLQIFNRHPPQKHLTTFFTSFTVLRI